MIDKPKPANKGYRTLYMAEVTGPNKYTNTQMDLDDYLHTSVWYKLRAKRLKMDNFRCQRCGAAINVQVHHIHYPEVWGEEDYANDLITLCDECHEAIHKNK